MYIGAHPERHEHLLLVASLRHRSLDFQVPSDPLTDSAWNLQLQRISADRAISGGPADIGRSIFASVVSSELTTAACRAAFGSALLPEHRQRFAA
jgi:hypothetical protein